MPLQPLVPLFIAGLILSLTWGKTISAGNWSALHPSTLRCAGSIVSVGDGADKLANLCGPPTAVQKNQGYTSQEPAYTTRADGITVRSGTKSVYHDPDPVEIWFYDFGPGRLVVYIAISKSGGITEITQGR